MPERDLGLAGLPAEIHDLSLPLRGKVDEAELHVLQVRATRLDLAHDAVELLDQHASRRTLADEVFRREVADRDPDVRREPRHLVLQMEGSTLQAGDQR